MKGTSNLSLMYVSLVFENAYRNSDSVKIREWVHNQVSSIWTTSPPTQTPYMDSSPEKPSEDSTQAA